jgi:hypothetical protein
MKNKLPKKIFIFLIVMCIVFQVWCLWMRFLIGQAVDISLGGLKDKAPNELMYLFKHWMSKAMEEGEIRVIQGEGDMWGVREQHSTMISNQEK